MERRRKPVPCVLCETETYNVSAVCEKCVRARNVGLDYLERLAAQEAETKPYIVNRRFSPSTNLDFNLFKDRFEHSVRFPQIELFFEGLELFGQTAKPNNRDYWGANPERIDVIPGDEKKNGMEFTPTMLLMTEQQAQGLRQIFIYIHQVATYEYRTGYQYGSSALMRLAEGEMSTDDFDAKYAKAMGEKNDTK